MSHPLSGRIPHLIARGTPVILTLDGTRAVVVAIGDDALSVAYEDGGVTSADDDLTRDEVVLDLDDPAGAVRGACWAWAYALHLIEEWSEAEYAAVHSALHDRPLSPEQVSVLEGLILRMARAGCGGGGA